MSLEQFKRDTRKIAKANGVKIRLLKREHVTNSFDDLPCSGYFSETPLELVVATKGREAEWLSVLVHESCHLDQYVDNRFLWDKCSPAFSVFSNWLTGESEPSTEVMEEVLQDIIRIELDCERRAIEKIKTYDLNLDITTYKQQANIVLYGYLFFYQKRTWCNDLLERRSIMDIAPKRLRRKYDKIPVKFYRVMQREFNKMYAA